MFFFISITGWSLDNTPEDLSVIAGSGLSYVFGGKNLNPAAGYHIGIEKNVFQFTEKSLLNMGIIFNMQSVNYAEVYSIEPYDMQDIAVSGKVSLSYLSIPIVYRRQSKGGFFWEVGIQTGFLLRSKDQPDNGEESDYKEYVKAVDIGIPAGIGYWFNKHISIGVRSVYGLTDMSANGAKIPPANSNHQNFIISGLLRFNITGK